MSLATERVTSLLEPLLRDDSVIGEVHGGHHESAYYIRRAAYETLTAWNVKVDKPLLVVPGSRKQK